MSHGTYMHDSLHATEGSERTTTRNTRMSHGTYNA